MPALYTLVLRECSDAAKAHVGQFLGKAFSLKEATCQTIASSAPIALLSDLTPEEAAVMQVVMSGLSRDGVVIQYSNEANDDLPKIDWPRRPAVFKREIAEYLADFSIPLPCPDCSAAHPLVEVLVKRLTQAWGDHGSSKTYAATEAPRPGTSATTGGTTGSTRPAITTSKPYTGSALPEITPFSTPALPSTPGQSGGRAAIRTPMPAAPSAAAANDDAVSRLNELFPEEENPAGFIPNNNDITSILNRLLPDEESSSSGSLAASVGQSSGRLTAVPVNGFSVFLAKIGDEARRQKAVPLLAELAKISSEEADTLSKKVIIPVLKGVSKDDAESAKGRFAKIGILARVKGGETQG